MSVCLFAYIFVCWFVGWVLGYYWNIIFFLWFWSHQPENNDYIWRASKSRALKWYEEKQTSLCWNVMKGFRFTPHAIQLEHDHVLCVHKKHFSRQISISLYILYTVTICISCRKFVFSKMTTHIFIYFLKVHANIRTFKTIFGHAYQYGEKH